MTNGGYLTRDTILAASDLEPTDVPVPEWGGTIRLRVMTAAEHEEWEDRIVAAKQDGRRAEHIRASLIALCAVDGNGARLFTAADIDALSAKSSGVVMRLFDACRKLNGMTTEEVKAAEKNSAPQPSDGSATV